MTGRFDHFEGTFTYTPDKPKEWTTTAVIQATSINTNSVKRDNHLRAPDFFDVEKYPVLSFQSTEGSTLTSLKGQLTIHGITRPVVFKLEVLGAGKDPWGNERAYFVATTTINRQDYGVTWSKTLETGGLMIGNDVDIILEIEGVLQK
jgi:polyisoprenoid-binding protein YceI